MLTAETGKISKSRWRKLGINSKLTYHPMRGRDASAVGKNCFIQELNNIQSTWLVTDVLGQGTHQYHGRINAFAHASHVILSGRCSVGSGTYFYVNATIRDGLTIADDILIGQGSNVTQSLTEPGAVGSPQNHEGLEIACIQSS